MKNATYHSKDQNWMNGSTTYWFEMNGELYGVVEGEGESMVDCDGAPVQNHMIRMDIATHCIVTDEMRAE